MFRNLPEQDNRFFPVKTQETAKKAENKPTATQASQHLLITEPPIRSVLYASPYIRLEGPHPMPNWWWRFWYWALLGWKWKIN